MLSWSLASLPGTGSSRSFSEMKVEVVLRERKMGKGAMSFQLVNPSTHSSALVSLPRSSVASRFRHHLYMRALEG